MLETPIKRNLAGIAAFALVAWVVFGLLNPPRVLASCDVVDDREVCSVDNVNEEGLEFFWEDTSRINYAELFFPEEDAPDTRLPVFDYGLDYRSSVRFEVPTEAAEELREYITQTDGGQIACGRTHPDSLIGDDCIAEVIDLNDDLYLLHLRAFNEPVYTVLVDSLGGGFGDIDYEVTVPTASELDLLLRVAQ